MEDPFFINQWHMNSLDELSMLPLTAAFGENLQQSQCHPIFNPRTSSTTSHSAIDRPMKQLKPNNWSSCKTNHASNPQVSSLPNLLSFVNSYNTNQMGIVRPKEEMAVCSKSIDTLPSDILISQGSFGNQNSLFKAGQGTKRISTNTRLSKTQDHIIAERKRREKLSQRFIALSAMVPGLKKVTGSILINKEKSV